MSEKAEPTVTEPPEESEKKDTGEHSYKSLIIAIIVAAVVVVLLIVVIVLAATLTDKDKDKSQSQSTYSGRRYTMYAWSPDLLNNSKGSNIISDMRAFNITDLYVEMSLSSNKKQLVCQLIKSGLDVYLLTGDTTWYKDVSNYKQYIDVVANYNTDNSDCPVLGVAFDVEPYSSGSEYTSDNITGFETYVNTIKEAYTYAHSKNVKLINVVPYWYDRYFTSDSYTDEQHARAEAAYIDLVKHSDRLSVMNYAKKNVVKNINASLRYAKEYGIEVESIGEFDEVAGDDEQQYISYYLEEDPMAAGQAGWDAILDEYEYDSLSFAYHHIDYIMTYRGLCNRYSLVFQNSEGTALTSSSIKYTLQYEDTVVSKRITKTCFVPKGLDFTITLVGYGDQTLLNEEKADKYTTKRIYRYAS